MKPPLAPFSFAISIVELEILRGEETITKTVERRKVEINYIETDILENNIGYIQILGFDGESSNEFKEKLDKLLQKGIKSLIIDVRDNGGGLVSEAINISELFLEKDKIIMRELDKTGKEKITKTSKNSKVNSDLKIIILSNENTASASEIFIGALKENNIAKVVGTKTYGKGVMQEIVSFIWSGNHCKRFRSVNKTFGKQFFWRAFLIDDICRLSTNHIYIYFRKINYLNFAFHNVCKLIC